MSSDTLEKKNTLSSVVDDVREMSYAEKKEKMTEEQVMDSFLDTINDFKKTLTTHTNKINEISSKMESLTWYTNPDDESLVKLNELIIMCRDTHSSLFQKYVSYNSLRKSNIATKEIIEYKHAVDLFKETFCDIESVFFSLPKNDAFQKTTDDISMLNDDSLH